MSATLATAAPHERFDPTDQPSAAPTRSGRLLRLVRGLIDFGTALIATLQGQPDAARLLDITLSFGTRNVALIIARITRGLRIAAALQERLGHSARRLDAPRVDRVSASITPAQKRQAKPRRAAALPQASDDAALLSRLPTAQEIAAQISNRSIGAVVEDICRDLGIVPTHPLWRELQEVVNRYGGNFNRVIRGMMTRITPLNLFSPDGLFTPQPTQPITAIAATGPP